MMQRPRPSRDAIIIAWLHGAATRHAGWTPPHGDQRQAAIAELQELAGDRPDLLGQVAGLMLGTAPSDHPQQKQIAAALLIEAGADPAVVEEWIPVGAERAQRAGSPLNDMRVTAEAARPFMWPPAGSRRRGDRPLCLTCACPADLIRHDEITAAIVTLPCGHRVLIQEGLTR